MRPGGILVHHPPDESSNVGIDLWPAKAIRARTKASEQPKASPMPGDNGFWFDHDLALSLQVKDGGAESKISDPGFAVEAEAVAGTKESAEAGEKADDE